MDESFARILPSYLLQIEASKPAKTTINLLGMAAEKKSLMQTESLAVWDYLLVTTLYENASRPGPLENAQLHHFQQATYSAANDWQVHPADGLSPRNILGKTVNYAKSPQQNAIQQRAPKPCCEANLVKKIANFVRYKTNNTRQLQLTQLPNVDKDDGVAS